MFLFYRITPLFHIEAVITIASMNWKHTVLVPLWFLTFSSDDKTIGSEILISYTQIWLLLCLPHSTVSHLSLHTPSISISLIPSPFPRSLSPWSLNASRPQFGDWWACVMTTLCFVIVIIFELVAPHHCSPRMRGRTSEAEWKSHYLYNNMKLSAKLWTCLDHMAKK